jgi:hypothetical protein
MGKAIDMTGRRCGRLTVKKRADNVVSKSGKSILAAWECLCDCGNTTIVIGASLRNGNTASCGCLQKQVVSKRMKTHGGSRTRLYEIWCGMKKRCNNPSSNIYEHYGGRGVRVCEEWEGSFVAFREWAIDSGYSDSLSIDRIDTNGNYCPDNCRWATDVEQKNNMRTNNRITYNGATKTAAEWRRYLGITKGKWDWSMKLNANNAQSVIAACAGEIAMGGNGNDPN